MDPALPAADLPMREEPTAPTAHASAASPPSAFDNVEPDNDVDAEVSRVGQREALATESRAAPTAAAAEHSPASDEGAVGVGISARRGDVEEVAAAPMEGAAVAKDVLPAAAADAEHRAPPSMKDLFGPFFQVDNVPERAADPALVDTRSMLHSHFGGFVQEADVLLQNEVDVLAREMRANKEAREQARVQQLFGEGGASILHREVQERFTVLRSTVPVNPAELFANDAEEAAKGRRQGALPADAERGLWLVEMPKMLPNRQTLHADPQPFFPSRCELLESDDRALYTPQNVLRWTHHQPTDTYMSNARVVRWSDGSFTLHVGSDTYSLDSSKSNAAAHILGSQTAVSKGSVTLPSITKTVNPGKHFVIESTEARSIERAVLAESAHHQAKTQRMKLAYAQAPLPEVDWTKPNAARNPQEEYVAMEYERRTKELQRRFKEGRPMTLREQLEEDAHLFQQLNSANVEELLERQREERRQAVLHAARRAQLSANGQRAGGRSRLDRDMGLAALNGADPFLQDGQRDETEENEHGETAEDSADEDIEAMIDRKRQRQEAEDEARAAKYADLVSALESLLRDIPQSDENAYGEVEGFLTYMKSRDFAPSILETEIPSLLKSVAEVVPGVDVSRVMESFKALSQ